MAGLQAKLEGAFVLHLMSESKEEREQGEGFRELLGFAGAFRSRTRRYGREEMLLVEEEF